MMKALESGASIELNEFRAREGAEIATEMHQPQHRRFATAAVEMEQISRRRILPYFKIGLHDRLKELLKSVQIGPAAPGAGSRDS